MAALCGARRALLLFGILATALAAPGNPATHSAVLGRPPMAPAEDAEMTAAARRGAAALPTEIATESYAAGNIAFNAAGNIAFNAAGNIVPNAVSDTVKRAPSAFLPEDMLSIDAAIAEMDAAKVDRDDAFADDEFAADIAVADASAGVVLADMGAALVASASALHEPGDGTLAPATRELYYSCWWAAANNARCGGYSCGCGKGCTRTCYYSCTLCYCSPGTYTPSYGYVTQGTTCPNCPGGKYQPSFGQTSCPSACPGVRPIASFIAHAATHAPLPPPSSTVATYYVLPAPRIFLSGVLLPDRLIDLLLVPGRPILGIM